MTCTDVRLLKGINQLCRVALDMGGGIRSCDITDPYVMVLLMDGTMARLQLVEEGVGSTKPKLQLTWPEVAKGSKVKLVSAYTDSSGLFVTESKKKLQSVSAVETSFVEQRHQSLDDEDELLYGDVDAITAKMSGKTPKMEVPDQVAVKEEDRAGVPTNFNWCAVYREDGTLEIYRVQDFKMVFCVRNFSSGPQTLKDSGPLTSE